MFLKLYKWFYPNKTIIVFDRNRLPVDGDTITVNGLTATFGQKPAVYFTTDASLDVQTFEEHYRIKFGKEALLMTVNPGHEITRVS